MVQVQTGPLFPLKDFKMPIINDTEKVAIEDMEVVDLVKDLGDKLVSEPFYAQMVSPEDLLYQQFSLDVIDFLNFNTFSLHLKAQLATIEEELMSENCGGLKTYLEYIRLTNGYNAVTQLYYMGTSQTSEDEANWKGFFNRDLNYYGFALPIIREYIESRGKVSSDSRLFLERFLLHSMDSYLNDNRNTIHSQFCERIQTLIQEVRS